MTCIVGLVCESGDIIVGSDARVSAGNQIASDSCQKIVKKDGMVIGCAGSMRMRDIFLSNFEMPSRVEWISDFEYLCDCFVSSVRECLESAKFSYLKDGVSEFTSSMILFVYKDKLYTMDSAYGIIDHENFMAIGSGSAYALGSLETTKGMKLDSETKVRMALNAACKFDSHCGGDIKIVINHKHE